MQKLFTLVCAVLATAMTMNAASGSWQFSGGDAPALNSSETGTNMKVEFLSTDAGKSYANEGAAYNAAVPADLKSKGAKGLKIGANALYLRVTLTEGKFAKGDTLFICGYLPWKVSSTAAQTGDVAASVATGTGKNDYNVGKVVFEEDVDTLYMMRAQGSSTAISAIKLTSYIPPTDPVTEVTIAGPTEGYVGKTITLTATTDVNADTLYWTVDGAVQDNHTETLELELAAARTYQVACFARNANNAVDVWISDSHSVVATVKPVLPQVEVSAATTWDWTKAAAVSEIKFSDSTTPKKNDTILLANVNDMNNDENFNSQALLFSGEYAIRDSKYCQGQLLSFTTTVAGYVSVEYSNTGNRTKEEERRFLTVNGTQVGDGTMSSSDHETTYDIAVPAGEVELSGVFNEGDPATAPQYLRFYKVAFNLEKIATALDNTADAVKATKRIVNGQLIIEKNGEVYNVLGARVR